MLISFNFYAAFLLGMSAGATIVVVCLYFHAYLSKKSLFFKTHSLLFLILLGATLPLLVVTILKVMDLIW